MDQKYPLTVTEEVASREVTLPLYPTLSDADVETVARAVQKTLKSMS
jgi:dTDP-4-amino-4,6-dideoxygalactose transaminase